LGPLPKRDLQLELGSRGRAKRKASVQTFGGIAGGRSVSSALFFVSFVNVDINRNKSSFCFVGTIVLLALISLIFF
jgi:hypothetical protein